MSTDDIKELILFVQENILFFLIKLIQNFCEKGKGVWQILHVVVDLAANFDNLCEDGFFNKILEIGFVFAEFSENSAGVERHLVVILIL